MSTSRTTENEIQEMKMIFSRLFKIGYQLEKLNTEECKKSKEIQQIVHEIDEIMESILKHEQVLTD